MKWHRIKGLLVRHLYLYPRSIPRLMDIFFWPILDLLVWGFLSVYLQKVNLGDINIVSVLLGAIIFWELLSRSQSAVSIAFLEDVWERNVLNIFVTPVRISEFLVSTMLLGFVRILLCGGVLAVLALYFYHFNMFQFGLYTIPFIINLLFFGWVLGIFTIAIILRFGSSAQMLAFGLIFLIQPFSAVFYPVAAIPTYLQPVAYLFPSTYVFEGMRTVIATGTIAFQDLAFAFGTNLIYMGLVMWFFYKVFAQVKVKGKLLKLD